MSIVESIKLYLGYTPDFINDVVIFSDGVNSYIKEWYLQEQEPTLEQLQDIYEENEDYILQNELDNPFEYYSWDTVSKQYVFNLDLYKNYIVLNEMENAFQAKLNSSFTLDDGFKIKPSWKELYASIQTGLDACSNTSLGDIVDIDSINKKITVSSLIDSSVLNNNDLLRIKESTNNNGFYQIINREILNNNTIFTVYQNVDNSVIDGKIYNDFCYIKSADNSSYKLVYTENISAVNSQLFTICNKLYQYKHYYEYLLRIQNSKENVDVILSTYINS